MTVLVIVAVAVAIDTDPRNATTYECDASLKQDYHKRKRNDY